MPKWAKWIGAGPSQLRNGKPEYWMEDDLARRWEKRGLVEITDGPTTSKTDAPASTTKTKTTKAEPSADTVDPAPAAETTPKGTITRKVGRPPRRKG